MDKDSGEPIALGFGISGGIGDSIASDMNCQCAHSYHESLKQGCRMKLSLTYFFDEAAFQVFQISAHEQKSKLFYSICICPQAGITECISQSMEVSAFSAKDNGLYFKKGHSRCLSNGNYDPIQCVDFPGFDGRCVCVNKWENDHLTSNGSTSFISSVSDLICFDPDIHDSNYYRPCEKVVKLLQVGKAMSGLGVGYTATDKL